MTPTHRFSIVACARWETRYITEWLTYHRMIGFDHVFLYCNDDDPAELYREVLPFTAGPTPFVSFTFFPEIGAQQAMYLHFLENHRHKTEWMCFLDIDEFLRLPQHRSVGGFVGSFQGRVDSIYLNWCQFGNNGFINRPAGDVLPQYTRRRAGCDSYMTKHITRTIAIHPDHIRRGPMSDFWHYWNPLEYFEALNIVNVLGEDMHRYYDSPEISRATFEAPGKFEAMLKTAIINHYKFKSKEDFLLRAERSVAGVFAQQIDHKRQFEDGRADQVLGYLNEVEDTELADLWCGWLQRFERVESPTSATNQPLSRAKPATQSSICAFSFAPTREQDAAGAVNGQIDGTRKFHTGFETNPWWQVDLENTATIRRIKIFNTSDETASRFKNFSLAVSIDGEAWAEIARKEDGLTVGNVHNAPYVWEGYPPAWGRYVRITALGENICLHLDQVEVYSDEPEPAQPNADADTTIVITSCNRHDLLEKNPSIPDPP